MKKITLFILAVSIQAGMNAQGVASDYLNINNINARVNASGDLFWDFANGQFEVPKNSGVGTIFADNLWIGGYDGGNNLKVSAQTYRQNGVDFWPGPLNSSGAADSATGVSMNKIWKLKQCDIDAYHNWVINGSPGQVPVDANTLNTLLTWPAAHPLTNGPLAPYFDYNQDGQYNVNQGDYPLIKGDEAAFFVYNDNAGVHTSSGGAAIGLEIQTMVYEYNCPDSALQNSIFVNYKIVNRSSYYLSHAYIGKWTYFDVGNPMDNYIGCDVTRGAYFGYNGDDNDETGYNLNPAAQAIVFLKGASADPNGLADPIDSSANGTGYGDGIIDNESLGMTRFMNYYNGNNSINGNPIIAPDYYNYLSGRWRDGSPWTYGAQGIGTGVGCDFLYPGASDPVGFGTHGGMPMAPWDEAIAGNSVSDRIALASTGPFTFDPGETQEIELAYVFGRDYSNPGALAGVQVMKNRIDSIRSRYTNGITACGCNSVVAGVKENSIGAEFTLSPNPASSILNIEFPLSMNKIRVAICNIQGQILDQKILNTSKETLDISDLLPGLYLLKASDGNSTSVQRFVKQ